jgi:hypothetical protein
MMCYCPRILRKIHSVQRTASSAPNIYNTRHFVSAPPRVSGYQTLQDKRRPMHPVYLGLLKGCASVFLIKLANIILGFLSSYSQYIVVQADDTGIAKQQIEIFQSLS